MSPARPAPKSTKMAQKRPRSETGELPAMDNAARNKSNHKDPLFSKHKKVERNHTELSKGIKVGIHYNWQDVSCDSWVLCDSLQKHALWILKRKEDKRATKESSLKQFCPFNGCLGLYVISPKACIVTSLLTFHQLFSFHQWTIVQRDDHVKNKGKRIMFMVVTVSDCRQLQVQYWCKNKCVYKKKEWIA